MRTGVIARRISLRRKPKADPVTVAVRTTVLLRDKQCFAYRVDPEHICRDVWGQKHSAGDMSRMTLDHVKDAARMGKRAPSDPAHLVAMCWDANVNGWASAHREEERSYLRAVSEPAEDHSAHVDPCGPTCREFVGGA